MPNRACAVRTGTQRPPREPESTAVSMPFTSVTGGAIVNPLQFDIVAKLFVARRRPRRARPVAGGTQFFGLLVAVLVLSAASVSSAQAQQATPTAESGLSWLMVQAFDAATLRPDSADATYTLTLADVDPAVLAFTDRPNRIVATVPTPDFVQAVSSQEADPLNATLVAPLADGADGLVVVELRSAEFDTASGSVTYHVTVLSVEDGKIAAVATPLAAPAATVTFGNGHLFVDDVQPPIRVPLNVCGNTDNEVGLLNPSFGNTCVNE